MLAPLSPPSPVPWDPAKALSPSVGGDTGVPLSLPLSLWGTGGVLLSQPRGGGGWGGAVPVGAAGGGHRPPPTAVSPGLSPGLSP